MTAFREVYPNLGKLRYICICSKIDDTRGYIEEEDYLTYCKGDGYVNCAIFKYMHNKCENLSLKKANGDSYNLPIINLEEEKYKHMCKEAKNVVDKGIFSYCDEADYADCTYL